MTSKNKSPSSLKDEYKKILTGLKNINKREKYSERLTRISEQFKNKKLFSKSIAFNPNTYKTLYYTLALPKLTYRFSVVLQDNIDPKILLKSVYDTSLRYPLIRMDIRGGFFHFYLEQNSLVPEIKSDNEEIAQEFDLERNYHLFRVVYYKKRVSIELSSKLADFTLAKDFMLCLLKRYIFLKYNFNVKDNKFISCFDKPNAVELYSPFYGLNYKKNNKKQKGIILTGEKENNITNVTTFEVEDSAYETISNGNPELFTANILKNVLLSLGLNNKNPIVIGILRDMRRFYQTESLHSFTLVSLINCSSQNFEFLPNPDEAVSFTKYKGKHLKYLPLLFKKNINYYKNVTAFIIDTGKFEVESNPYILQTESIIGGKVNLAVSLIRYNKKLTISISSKFIDTKIEYLFYNELKGLGLDPLVDTNRRNCLI